MINSRKLEKIEKLLGSEIVSDINSLSSEALDAQIVTSSASIKAAEEELEANEEFQQLKESVKAMGAGMREVRKFQNAKIQLSLHLLESKGNQ